MNETMNDAEVRELYMHGRTECVVCISEKIISSGYSIEPWGKGGGKSVPVRNW